MTLKIKNIWCTSFEDNLFADGSKNDPGLLAAAMPLRFALGKWIKITYNPTGKSVIVQVRDVGPYSWIDQDYVKHGKGP